MSKLYHMLHKAYRHFRLAKAVKLRYKKNKENFSTEYADVYRTEQLAVGEGRSADRIKAASDQKTRYIVQYLRKECAEIVRRFADQKPSASGKRADTIWVFWWTGEETAPDLVKACINSIRKNANGHKVVMLDQTNYQKYVNLPEHIIRKHDSGLIGHAHFSDIVRLSLLASYGGAWIDATVYLSQPLPDVVFTRDFYTMRAYNPDALYPSKSRWCGYFLAGETSFPLFAFTRDCLITYWQKHDTDIDYLLMDYIMIIGYESVPAIRESLDTLGDNNLLRNKLMSCMNEPFSEPLFRELAEGDTFVSKLSWRYGNLITATKDGAETNYGHFLSMFLS